jgi:hypothetical protein
MPGPDPTAADLPPCAWGTERRAWKRCRLALGGLCRVVLKPEFCCCRVPLHDVSAGGVGLLLRQPLAVGAVLLVELPAARPGLAPTRLARVTHATAWAEGVWLVGCALASPLAEHEVPVRPLPSSELGPSPNEESRRP